MDLESINLAPFPSSHSSQLTSTFSSSPYYLIIIIIIIIMTNNNNNNNNENNKNKNKQEERPATPQNKNTLFIPFNSPRTPHPIPLSHPPSPIPRDDIIEGMSASTGSIFERDVENFDASLTAQEAIQLAVPPVLDEAIEALATVSPENILVDQIPLEYHLFNSTLSANSTDHTQPSSPNNNNSNNNNNPSLPASSSSSSSPHNQLSAISSSTPTAAHHHHQSHSVPSYPFPSFNSPAQLSPSPPSSHPPPPSPPSIPPRLHHQTLSCTSDTASISDPSSPRSLSPTPSFKIGRSMVTQLATDPDSFPTLTAHNNHPLIPAEILSTNALLKNEQPATLLSPVQPVQQILFTKNDNNKPDQETPQTFRQRKTCISFMSYVDILNSERSDHSSDSAAAPSSSAMNALRMARKSTSSLVKRASSIFSHSSRVRSSSKKNINLLSTSPNENLGKAWVNRSRCTSSNTTYHSCPTQRSASEIQHNPSAGLETPEAEAEAEVLGEFHWN
ncbi:uncharacterized protein PGTG_16918 [Puccinia graminis f. sp. tritici CRL 75-36-700-3]|uniref:Uncharacterized protein n=1 Tax=Puccinia graminis f. sp. tritici (strain CRL 75-36-700-3 / race SCCL) TaxID=418459 RepID=E3L3P8_PUCGT|nr:uncharacterized protein PGTG_16918 [Puccinia graminis f. sp. tritici CRL 75-36-700-3]EFP91173.2 hypothetical protein PGTG_16918 [Puccinia graminis f. sp. tritici CRL 75-36-700-3]